MYEALRHYLPPVLLPVFVPAAEGEKLDASCTMKRTLSSAARPPFESVFVLVVKQVVKWTCCRVGLLALGGYCDDAWHAAPQVSVFVLLYSDSE